MPIVNFPEFEQYKKEGYKGTFVGGCIERGEGSSFRRKAHAHCYKRDSHFGWICVRSPKRLYNKAGQASLLMWHEMAHITTQSGHGREFYIWLKAHSIIRKKEERISQWAYLARHYKDPVAAYRRIKGLPTRRSGMAKKTAVAVAEAPAVEVNEIDRLTGDTVKEMGPAKGGGRWYKNYHTGALYRVEKKDGALVVAEKRAGNVSPNVAKKDRVKGISRAAKKGDGTSRKELMEAVKAAKISYYRVMNKAEMQEVLKSGTTAKRIAEIQKQAKDRWTSGWGKNAQTQKGAE